MGNTTNKSFKEMNPGKLSTEFVSLFLSFVRLVPNPQNS